MQENEDIRIVKSLIRDLEEKVRKISIDVDELKIRINTQK